MGSVGQHCLQQYLVLFRLAFEEHAVAAVQNALEDIWEVPFAESQGSKEMHLLYPPKIGTFSS